MPLVEIFIISMDFASTLTITISVVSYLSTVGAGQSVTRPTTGAGNFRKKSALYNNGHSYLAGCMRLYQWPMRVKDEVAQIASSKPSVTGRCVSLAAQNPTATRMA